MVAVATGVLGETQAAPPRRRRTAVAASDVARSCSDRGRLLRGSPLCGTPLRRDPPDGYPRFLPSQQGFARAFELSLRLAVVTTVSPSC